MGVSDKQRGYAWGTQDDYQTPKTMSANALRQIVCTDNNSVDYTGRTANDDDWSWGFDGGTDEWIEAHDARVSHTMPGFSQELGRVFKLSMGDYTRTTPTGGTLAKEHTFNPVDLSVSNQLQAVDYAERWGNPYGLRMPSAVCDGFSLKGSELGALTCDFGLQGSGQIIRPPDVIWTGAGATVQNVSGLKKLFNTQIGLEVNDGTANKIYGCRYKSFTLDYKNVLNLDGGYNPGCNRYMEDGNRNSGAIRSGAEVTEREIAFGFEVDLQDNSEELDAVIKQIPMNILLSAISDYVIEGSIKDRLTATMPLVKYSAAKLGEGNGTKRFNVSGRVKRNAETTKWLEIKLINDVQQYDNW